MDATTPLIRLQWALEDLGQMVARTAHALIKTTVAGSLLYVLAPPLAESITAPTMSAAHELPYIAAKRADRVIATGQAVLQTTLGVKVAADSCGPTQRAAANVFPRHDVQSEVQLMDAHPKRSRT